METGYRDMCKRIRGDIADDYITIISLRRYGIIITEDTPLIVDIIILYNHYRNYQSMGDVESALRVEGLEYDASTKRIAGVMYDELRGQDPLALKWIGSVVAIATREERISDE